MFDRQRAFLGYRGFGVCRDAEGFIARTRVAAAPASDNANIVPFRAAAAAEAETPALSPVERAAFHELARELGARLRVINRARQSRRSRTRKSLRHRGHPTGRAT